jgi:hypothetical protein
LYISNEGNINKTTVGIVNNNKNNNDVNNNSIFFERKIEEATAGLAPYYSRVLFERVSKENALTIVQYIFDLRREINPSDHYRMSVIKILASLAEFHNNRKSFKEMIKEEDILAFLDSFRKPEVEDPLLKWIGTYNLYIAHLTRFFKWLYYQDVAPDKRPKPAAVQNIFNLKRKEQSIYKPTDLWTLVLLKKGY